MCMAVDPAASLSTHSILPMVSFVDHVDLAASSASKVVDDGEAPDNNEPEMGRRGSRVVDGEVYDTTRKRAIDEIDTNGAPEKWCATTIY